MKRLKILHIAEIRGIGGLQVWVKELAKEQIKNGHSVNIMLPKNISNQSNEYNDSIQILTWNTNEFSDYDVINTHGSECIFPIRNRKSKNLSIIHTYAGTIAGIKKDICWKYNIYGSKAKLMVPWKIFPECISGWYSDHVIVNSNKTHNEVIKYYKIRNEKISLVCGGYQLFESNLTKNEIREKYGLPLNDILILCVGRPDPVKGLNELLLAFCEIKKIFKNIKLVLAPKHQEHDDTISLDMPYNNMHLLYKACDLFVCPSIYDGYSLATHEALAYGLPSIVSKNAGIAMHCRNSENSILLDYKARSQFSNELIEAIKFLLLNKNRSQEIGKIAKKDFSHLTWNFVAKETDKIYLNTLLKNDEK